MDKLLYDRREAARLLSLSLRTLDHLIAEHQLIVRRVGRRVLVPHGSLEKFVRAHHFLSKRSPVSDEPSQDSVACASEMPQDAQQYKAGR